MDYHAWSTRNLLICLLVSGAVSDADPDAPNPMNEYDDVLNRALLLLRLNGIESQVTLLLMTPPRSRQKIGSRLLRQLIQLPHLHISSCQVVKKTILAS